MIGILTYEKIEDCRCTCSCQRCERCENYEDEDKKFSTFLKFWNDESLKIKLLKSLLQHPSRSAKIEGHHMIIKAESIHVTDDQLAKFYQELFCRLLPIAFVHDFKQPDFVPTVHNPLDNPVNIRLTEKVLVKRGFDQI